MRLPDQEMGILESLPIGIVYQFFPCDSAPGPIQVNDSARKMLRLSPLATTAELLALRFELDPELSPAGGNVTCQQSPIKMALAGEYVNRRDIMVHGQPMHVQSQVVPALHGDWHVLCVQPRDHRLFVQSSESGDMLSAEISLRDTLAFDKLISRLSTQFINARPSEVESHIEEALAALGEFCQADRTYVFQFDEQLTEHSNIHEWVRDGVTMHLDELQNIPRSALPWFFDTMVNEGVFVVHDVKKIPESGALEQKLFDEEDIQSVICVGMYSAGQLLGFVGCDMVARQRQWSEADIRRIKLVGEMIANALQNQRYLISLEEARRELTLANQQLQELADKDSLTELANRRYFDKTLALELRRANRQQQSLSLAIVDIDMFKDYNDHFGHPAGDEALQQVSKLFRNHFQRSGELVARYGGEEFAVILPARNLSEAIRDLQQLQLKLTELAISHPTSTISNRLTFSAGIATFTPQNEALLTTTGTLIAAADAALYKAKKDGRNRVFGQNIR